MPPFEIPYTFSYGVGSSGRTVASIIDEVQAFMQDIGAIRYAMTRYISALNAALAEGYRLRPDFYRGIYQPPRYTVDDYNNAETLLSWPETYLWPLIMFCVGYVELTDAQGNEDTRGAAFTTAFVQKLTGAAK